MITEAQKRALLIIKTNPGLQPKRFAKLMWPDSDGWRRSAKCGGGSHRGGGMYLAAGGFLGKLAKAKLINMTFMRKGELRGAYITQAGREAVNLTKSPVTPNSGA